MVAKEVVPLHGSGELFDFPALEAQLEAVQMKEEQELPTEDAAAASAATGADDWLAQGQRDSAMTQARQEEPELPDFEDE